MPKFSYQAYGTGGEFAQGTFEGSSLAEVEAALQLRGLTVFAINQQGASKPWWQRELLTRKPTLTRHLPGFTRELATLVDAGIPIDRVLRLLAQHGASRHVRDLASDLLSHVLDGAALSDAMRRHPLVFSADYVSIVRAGETGGTMAKVLLELAELLEKRRETQAQIQSALIYPAIVVVAAAVTLAVVTTTLVPTIVSAFAESGRPLPSAVKALAAVQAHGFEIALGAAVLVGGLAFALRASLRRPTWAERFDRFKLGIPLLGKLLHYREAARFARTLGTLVQAGVPLMPACQAAREGVANRFIASRLQRANDHLREGGSLQRALSRESVLPPILVQTIAIGEEAGTLAQVLLRSAAALEQQSQRLGEKFITVLAPGLTVAMALLVGGILVTVMSAILSINELAGQ